MSKYEPLWNYVMQHEPGQFSLTFDEIENVLGFQIDHSFLKYKKELRQTMKKNKHTASIGESRILLCGYHEKQCCKKRQDSEYGALQYC